MFPPRIFPFRKPFTEIKSGHLFAYQSVPSNVELIDIGINARVLIGIDKNWALIEGVLHNGHDEKVHSFLVLYVSSTDIPI